MLCVTTSEINMPGGNTFRRQAAAAAEEGRLLQGHRRAGLPHARRRRRQGHAAHQGPRGPKPATSGWTTSPPSADTNAPADKVVAQAKIVDLTDKLDERRQADLEVPEGNWTILRIGYTPTGSDQSPGAARRAGAWRSTSSAARRWTRSSRGMMQTVIDDNRALVGKGLNDALIDSYEVGSQNWTPLLRSEFITRRGYDPLPWLVTLSGRVVRQSLPCPSGSSGTTAARSPNCSTRTISAISPSCATSTA